jgi:hypothetical protein
MKNSRLSLPPSPYLHYINIENQNRRGSPTASYFLFNSKKKVTKEIAAPMPLIPCVASSIAGDLRNALTSHTLHGLLRSLDGGATYPLLTVLLSAA